MIATAVATLLRPSWLRRALAGGALAMLLSGALPLTASADLGRGYTVDPDPNIGRDPAPVSYVFDHDITLLADLQHTAAQTLKNPSGLFLDSHQHLWIADTDNNRLLELDQNDHLLRIVGQTDPKAPQTPATLNGPQGLFVTADGTIYVADSGNSRVVVFDKNGKFVKAFGRPQTELLSSDASYKPTNLVVDKRGYLYVVNGGGDYRGVVEMDPEGIFRGFFGANHNQFSFSALFTRLFATQAQKQQILKELPSSDTNLFLSDDGFIYTVASTAQIGQIKKLNALGVNVYKVTKTDTLFGLGNDSTQAFFGEKPQAPGEQLPQFVAIAVDNTGIITALDAASGKVYQYDQSGNMLDIFGGKASSQDGYFDYPAALAIRQNGDIYVLDSSRKDIQVFRPTQFALLIHQGSVLYYDGKYQESAAVWQQLLRMDAHYSLAHQLLGESYLKMGEFGGTSQDYVLAMQEARLAQNRVDYSAAFAQYRHDWAQEHFGLIIGVVIGGIVLLLLIVRPIGRLIEAAMQMG